MVGQVRQRVHCFVFNTLIMALVFLDEFVTKEMYEVYSVLFHALCVWVVAVS